MAYQNIQCSTEVCKAREKLLIRKKRKRARPTEWRSWLQRHRPLTSLISSNSTVIHCQESTRAQFVMILLHRNYSLVQFRAMLSLYCMSIRSHRQKWIEFPKSILAQ